MVTTLKECNSAKTLRYFENRFEKYDLVVADELGYTSFDREGTDLLFKTYKAILVDMEGDKENGVSFNFEAMTV